jgi:8-oxo-dGTP pyrophosphatase MutT (NUDIX family)
MQTSRFEILAQGSYRRAQVVQRRAPQPFDLRADLQALARSRWDLALTTAAAQGRLLYDAGLFRLSRLSVEGNQIQLDYGQTCYRDYAMTRADCARAPWSGNPDPIGTAIIAVTADGAVPLGRRRASADVNPGRFFTFGGFFDLDDLDETGTPDVFACAAREWREETGQAISMDALRLISVVYDRVHPHPEIAFCARTQSTRHDIETGGWGDELADLAMIPAGELRDFAARHESDFTDSLLGAIEAFDVVWRGGRLGAD